MKEKKIVLSVVLGLSLVIFAIALMAELIDSLTLFTDFTKLNYTKEKYHITAGVLQLTAVIIGIALIALSIPKKSDSKIKIIVLSCFLLYMTVAVIVLKVNLPATSSGNYFTAFYTIFTSYLSFFATAVVTSSLYIVCSVMLNSQKSKECAKSEDSAVSAQSDTEETN